MGALLSSPRPDSYQPKATPWVDHWPCKEGLPVPNLEAGCENKYASSYIGEPFGENSVGGKWLIGAGLRIQLTL